MSFLETEFLDNPLYLWLLAALVTIAILFMADIFKKKAARRLIEKKDENKRSFPAFLGSFSLQTRDFFIIIVAVYLGSLMLELSPEIENLLHVVTVTVIMLQIGFWGASSIEYWVNWRVQQELEQNNQGATTLSGLGLIARVILWGILIILILENITGIEVNTLVASLGVTGIAVALAVQNILGDLFASLSITMDRPFVIGDFIEVGDFSGSVEHIGLKSTRIRSLTGEQLIFSNSDLLNSRIRNQKRMNRRRILFTINVPYGTPPDKLQRVPEIVREIIISQDQTTFDRAHFKEFRDMALNFEIVYYMETPDYQVYMDTQQAVNLAIMRRFIEEDIDFAHPAQLVRVQGTNSNGSSAS